MDTATSPLVERIARVLAGQRASINGEGDLESASDVVEETWKLFRNDALAVLHTIRAPTPRMAAAGDIAAWERMVLTAIDEGKPGIVM